MSTVMSADVLVALLQAFDRAGIQLWLDGGWAVDASLDSRRVPTRRRCDSAASGSLRSAASSRPPACYARQEGGTESNFVLVDPLDTKVDVHAIDLDVQGNGVYRMEDMERLRARFGVELPPQLRRRT